MSFSNPSKRLKPCFSIWAQDPNGSGLKHLHQRRQRLYRRLDCLRGHRCWSMAPRPRAQDRHLAANQYGPGSGPSRCARISGRRNCMLNVPVQGRQATVVQLPAEPKTATEPEVQQQLARKCRRRQVLSAEADGSLVGRFNALYGVRCKDDFGEGH